MLLLRIPSVNLKVLDLGSSLGCTNLQIRLRGKRARKDLEVEVGRVRGQVPILRERKNKRTCPDGAKRLNTPIGSDMSQILV